MLLFIRLLVVFQSKYGASLMKKILNLKDKIEIAAIQFFLTKKKKEITKCLLDIIFIHIFHQFHILVVLFCM